MSQFSSWWKEKAWPAIRKFFGWDPPTTTTISPTTTKPPSPSCTCDLTKPLCEPILRDKEQECPVPGGKDLRGWVWSIAKRDVVMCGTTMVSEKLFSASGNQISGICKVLNGQQWHYKGYKPKSSSDPLTPGTGTYQGTAYRLIYETRTK